MNQWWSYKYAPPIRFAPGYTDYRGRAIPAPYSLRVGR